MDAARGEPMNGCWQFGITKGVGIAEAKRKPEKARGEPSKGCTQETLWFLESLKSFSGSG